MKPTPLRDERAGEHEHAGGPYILRHGDTLYRVTAATARDATAEVLAFLDDPKVWRGEIEAFTEALYRELHGAPDDVVDVEPGPGAFPSGYYVEAACPVCRPGAVADGARPVRCVLHGGDEAIQPTNASASGFRLAGDGRGDGAAEQPAITGALLTLHKRPAMHTKASLCLSALTLTAVLVGAGGCSGPVTHIPEPTYQSHQEMRTAFNTFDAQSKERQVGGSLDEALEAVERVRQRIMPAAQRVCARVFSHGCPEAFASMKVRVYAQDETINAFAAADGTLGFYGGFVRMTGNDDELAAVMAHEVAHILFGHNQAAAANETLGALAGMAAGLAIMAGTGVYNQGMQDMTQSFTEAGTAAGRLAYSPEMELEADHFAVFALAEAGYDPEKGGKVFLRMARTLSGDQQAGRKSFVSYFNTHPADDHRLAVWYEGIAAVRRGQTDPLTKQQRRRAEEQAKRQAQWKTASDVGLWENPVQLVRKAKRQAQWKTASDCDAVRAAYPKCPWWRGEEALFWEFLCPRKGPWLGPLTTPDTTCVR